VGAGAQHVAAEAQHDDLQRFFLHPQRASAVLEQRTSAVEHRTAAAANFIMTFLLAKRGGQPNQPKPLADGMTAGEG
jgi:hypothetical protein